MVVAQGPVPENEAPRFSGPASFMKYPWYDPENPSAVVVVGAPFDGGTTYRAGARMGPHAIRESSRGLYPYHRDYGRVLHQDMAVADGGDLPVVPMSVPRTQEKILSALRAYPRDCRVLLLGGDHSVSLAHLRWVAERLGPVSLLHLDAHSDLWDSFWDDRYNHATVFRRALEEGLFRPETSVQVGLRGSLDDAEENRFGEQFGIHQITTRDWYEGGTGQVVTSCRSRLGSGPIYISVDVDVVDPGFVPGTGTPEAGGPSSYMVLDLLRRLQCPIVGADVVELAPDLDPTGSSSLVAATIAQDLLFLLTIGRDSTEGE